jgi:hypothetical protein
MRSRAAAILVFYTRNQTSTSNQISETHANAVLVVLVHLPTVSQVVAASTVVLITTTFSQKMATRRIM